jgi:hypothetical protein
MLCYDWLESLHTGLGIAALLIPLTMVTAGAFGFLRMRAAVTGLTGAHQAR